LRWKNWISNAEELITGGTLHEDGEVVQKLADGREQEEWEALSTRIKNKEILRGKQSKRAENNYSERVNWCS